MGDEAHEEIVVLVLDIDPLIIVVDKFLNFEESPIEILAEQLEEQGYLIYQLAVDLGLLKILLRLQVHGGNQRIRLLNLFLLD